MAEYREFTPDGGLPDSAKKEQFSIAYLRAIAAAKGYTTKRSETDYNSIDMEVSRGKYIITDEDVIRPDPEICFQLKATSRDLIRGDVLKFPLSKKNYDDLRQSNFFIPRILLVVLVPKNCTEWIGHQDKVYLNTKGYYYNLKGASATYNKTSTTIYIPLENEFNGDILHKWMNQIANGDEIE